MPQDSLTPDELLARLATLVPPPRVHGLRYHGVFAPNSKARRRVVPRPPAPCAKAEPVSPAATVPLATPPLPPPPPYRVPWVRDKLTPR